MVQSEREDLTEEIRTLNGVLTKKGLRLVPVRRTGKKTLLYLYRPNRLKADLTRPEAAEILRNRGYASEKPACCLAELCRHLRTDESFPHEIGLFLGYPPADVRGFMKSPCEGVKCVGCWKVYDHAEEAQETFERYRRCTAAYCTAAKNGRSIEALIVSA